MEFNDIKVVTEQATVYFSVVDDRVVAGITFDGKPAFPLPATKAVLAEIRDTLEETCSDGSYGPFASSFEDVWKVFPGTRYTARLKTAISQDHAGWTACVEGMGAVFMFRFG